ncbi:PTS sugar transporter subunit IIA [bacterium]|nr:PTS sugar transporter subunit IIA [bacterium]RQV94304.1 MAG: PTS sugar transporter subunit IIA [bacterium]
MIYLRQYLDPAYVVLLEEENKEDVLNRLIDSLVTSPNILDKETFRKEVFKREGIISTGIGLGIAIPHVKIKEVKDITICVGVSRKGIEWGALDNQPVHIVFLIAGNAGQHELYLRLLSKIVLVLKNAARRNKIIQAKNGKDVLDLFTNL